MILFNQTRDPFDPNSTIEETLSQIMDRRYSTCKEEISHLFGRRYSEKRFELERRYQQLLVEDEVNQLLQCVLKTIDIIQKINVHYDFPMVDLDYFDLRDFPQIYNEVNDLYFRLYKKGEKADTFVLSMKSIALWEIHEYKTYCISELEAILSRLSKLVSLYDKLNAIQKDTNSLRRILGYPEEEYDTINPEFVTIEHLSEYIERTAKKLDSYLDKCNVLEQMHKEKQFATALEKAGDNSIIVFSTVPYGRENFIHIPELNARHTAFILKTSSCEEIKKTF